MRKVLIFVLFIIFFSTSSLGLNTYKARKFPMQLDFSKVETSAGDNYLSLQFPCLVLLVNGREGALRVNEWHEKLKEEYPKITIYAVAELKFLPTFWEEMVIDMLSPEPIIYFYDYQGSINEQLFHIRNPFTQEKTDLPELSLLVLKKDHMLMAKPFKIKKYSLKGEVFEYLSPLIK